MSGAFRDSPKMIALIDCNSFYCACEQVFRPDLDHRPVVVLSNNDGCVIARNQLAKGCGIPMGAVYYKYESMMRQNNVAVFSANFSLYANFSSRVMRIIRKFSPVVDVYSIDEAFVDLDACPLPCGMVEYAQLIRRTILKQTGIHVSIGIGKTKVLAKCANRLAKQNPSVNGVFLLHQDTIIEMALKQMPVHDIWGIGKQQAKRCYALGIKSAYDLKQYPNRQRLLKKLTKLGGQIQDELNGINCIVLHALGHPRKQILSSRSLTPELTKFDDLAAALSLFITRAMEKCRRQKSLCQTMTIFLHTNPFSKSVTPYSNSMTVGFLEPINDTLYAVGVARRLLSKIYKAGVFYKKIGVILGNLSDQKHRQLSLIQRVKWRALDKKVERKSWRFATAQRLMVAMDVINRRYGQDVIQVATNKQFLTKRKHPKQVSPRYTTSWADLLVV